MNQHIKDVTYNSYIDRNYHCILLFSYSENIPQSIVISRTIALAAIVLCVYALIVFKKFWSIFLEYNLNTDSVILHKITDKVQRLLIQQRPSIEYLEYMDIYYQILYTKLKAESYIDLIDVQKKQSDLILGVLSNYYPLDNHDNPELNNNLNQLFINTIYRHIYIGENPFERMQMQPEKLYWNIIVY